TADRQVRNIRWSLNVDWLCVREPVATNAGVRAHLRSFKGQFSEGDHRPDPRFIRQVRAIGCERLILALRSSPFFPVACRLTHPIGYAQSGLPPGPVESLIGHRGIADKIP